MSLPDNTEAHSHGEENQEVEKRNDAVENKDHELAATFTDPSDIMQTAQEMVKTLMQKAPEGEESEKVESEFSTLEIEAMTEERKVILEEMAAKIGRVQSRPKNRETKEIMQEAWENWEDGLQ